MKDLFPLLRPALHALDAETAHKATLRALAMGLHPRDKNSADPILAQTLWNLEFKNPVGMAAGFDKNAEALDGIFALGFGFVEAGTVTPRPQTGNPRPRVFRDPAARAVINRMGFPNDGMNAFTRHYRAFREKGRNRAGIVGINIGKNKDTEDAAADYLTLIERFAPMADYLAVNVSSPNTPGLRALQGREYLLPMLDALLGRRALVCGPKQPPLLVKFAPDLTQDECEDIAKTVLEAGIDGLILTNTTIARPDTLATGFAQQQGGLSGAPLRDRATETIRAFYALTGGRLPIIGAGGISSATDAYAKIRAGASLVELYTALVYHGPALVGDIKSGLADLLRRDGFGSITEAIGADHR